MNELHLLREKRRQESRERRYRAEMRSFVLIAAGSVGGFVAILVIVIARLVGFIK